MNEEYIQHNDDRDRDKHYQTVQLANIAKQKRQQQQPENFRKDYYHVCPPSRAVFVGNHGRRCVCRKVNRRHYDGNNSINAVFRHRYIDNIKIKLHPHFGKISVRIDVIIAKTFNNRAVIAFGIHRDFVIDVFRLRINRYT